MTNQNHLQQLQKLLGQLFQIDKAELDFGMYKIMNYKKDEVDTFISKTLPAIVEKEFGESEKGISNNQEEDFEKEESELKKAAEKYGVKLEEMDKWKELQEKKAQVGQSGAGALSPDHIQKDIYDYIYKFFKRYFQDGDFYSKKRYSSKSKYSIDYNGEETSFHWTNQDQYYIKTAENFSNYVFKVKEGVDYSIDFRIVEAQTDTNNNKSADKRYFILSSSGHTITDKQAVFLYEYRALTAEEEKNYKKWNTQDNINEDTYTSIMEQITDQNTRWYLTQKATETKDVLQRHIAKYTAKNSEDYFIHKDIKGFLRRELDFYIKNEVLFLDDLGLEDSKHFEKNYQILMTMIVVIKKVSFMIIEFVAQLEDYQKKLFEKKKFIYDSNYIISLSHIDSNFLGEIISNESQIEEWKELWMIDKSQKVDTDFLQGQQTLVVDTKHFSNEWKWNILAQIEDLDEKTSGTLIHSENFQALNLLEWKYKEQIKCIYIDPPYNTGWDGFIYKDGYQHSSWLSLMNDRLRKAKELMSDDGVIFSSIDDNELTELDYIMKSIFNEEKIAVVPVLNNLKWNNDEFGFAWTHEYLVSFMKNSEKASLNLLSLDDEWIDDWEEDEYWYFKKGANLKRTGEDAPRAKRPNWYFPLYISPDLEISLEKKDWHDELYPISWWEEMSWRWSRNKFKENQHNIIVSKGNDWYSIYKKQRPDIGGVPSKKPKSILYKPEYSTWNWTNQQKDFFWERVFKAPKSSHLVKDIVEIGWNSDGSILDFFAGSGTTWQAVMNLNKEDNKKEKWSGKRKFLLVEMWEYFESVLMKRIKKVMYSDNWKEGKATDNDWHHQIVKYFSLEQYEDTLNNLTLTNKIGQADFMKGTAKDQFMMKYMLDLEGRESLFDIDTFIRPFSHSMKITKNGEMTEKNIDLIETFNYLVGITVKTVKQWENGVFSLVGTLTKENKKKEVLVVWRDMENISQEDFTAFYDEELKGDYNKVFINGSTYNIAEAEMIEEVFYHKMIG